MFNGLKIKTNSINLLSLVGGAAIAAATLALTGTALPASAASITYSNWANIGPQSIGDRDNGKFTLKITDGGDVSQAGKVLFQFTSDSLADGIYISEVYFFDNGGLFKKTSGKYNASVSPTFSDAIANTSSYSGLSFADGSRNLPQGSSVNLTASTTLGKSSFSFNKSGSGGNVNSISAGETLGVLVDLATGKSFTDVLNSLTQNSNLIVAAHIIGYPNLNDPDNGLSDGFYYGNPYSTSDNGTGDAIFYDGYKTPTDPNPDTRTTAPAPVPAAVPEPLTILGAATAAGFGASFKRRLAKVKGNQKAD